MEGLRDSRRQVRGLYDEVVAEFDTDPVRAYALLHCLATGPLITAERCGTSRKLLPLVAVRCYLRTVQRQ